MSTNFIDEYLVKLGSSVDRSGMQNFYQALREAAAVSDSSAKAIAGSFFKAQTEIVSGFVAIGGAAIGLVDKIAMADQSYRLFALHMYMSKDAARSLKIAMDALGEPLENLTFDKELRERTHQLIMDQRAMAPDGDFEAQMRKIRDIRFEFTRMEVEGEYLAMHVVQDFMKALGLGPDELLNKLRGFNDWVTHDLPEISAKIVGIVTPVWNDVKDVFLATGEAVKATAIAFDNLIGIFDHSVGGTSFSLEKTGRAVADVVHWFAVFAESIANVEAMLAHLVSALAMLFQLNFSGAASELHAALGGISSGAVGAIAGGATGGWLAGAGGATLGGLLGSAFGPAGTAIGAAVGGAAGGAGGALGGAFIGSNLASSKATTVYAADTSVGDLLDKYSAAYGVDPSVVRALANVESGGRQNAVSSTGALGIMQLLPSTARGLGVNPYDADDNVRGGVAYFSRLLREYGTVPNAVAAYHEGEPKMNAILAGRATLSTEARGEVAKVMRQLGTRGDVQVGSIIVNVNKPNAVNADVGNAVAVRLRDLGDKRVQRNLSEFQNEAWGY